MVDVCVHFIQLQCISFFHLRKFGVDARYKYSTLFQVSIYIRFVYCPNKLLQTICWFLFAANRQGRGNIAINCSYMRNQWKHDQSSLNANRPSFPGKATVSNIYEYASTLYLWVLALLTLPIFCDVYICQWNARFPPSRTLFCARWRLFIEWC